MGQLVPCQAGETSRPLGCTGARQVVTLVHYLEDKGLKTGIVSMCIGTGMGAAAIIALES